MGPRREVGYGNLTAATGGAVAFVIGLYLCGYTRINLLTGSTTHPLLVPGIVLVVAGLVGAVLGSAGAKRRLRGAAIGPGSRERVGGSGLGTSDRATSKEPGWPSSSTDGV